MDRLGAKQMYVFYKKQYPDSDVSYTLFKYTISEFFKKAIKQVLNGKEFYLGHKLGSIRIRKVARNFDKPTINWFETNKLKAKGINKHVFFTDEFWYRFSWNKRSAALKNKSVYKFSATEGANGNKKQLVRKLREDDFAHINFKE